MKKPRLIIFASGSKEGGGSGFRNLVEHVRTGVLNANIVAVVSNYADGGVAQKAKKLGVPFAHFDSFFTAARYQDIVAEHNADYIALSGWLKLVRGLDPARTINIHPGPLPRFGGKGMYGHYVHEKVMQAYEEGEVEHSAVSMHFVTECYDEGPLFFHYPVAIRPTDTADTLATRVNAFEHAWQPYITNLVLQGKIAWNGADPATLTVPENYLFLP